MDPVVTPVQMAAIDADASEPVEELIERAGWATARAAAAMLDHSLYGKRIAVLAGRGNNGADGRSAARHLERGGARCRIFDIGSDSARGPGPHRRSASPDGTSSSGRDPVLDLVIDACYGTGLSRRFDQRDLPIEVGAVPVLAVDIPSGVDGLTGELRGHPLCATVTVTFAGLKPGLLLDPGRRFAGEIRVADIGLDCSGVETHHLQPADIVAHWPRRPPGAHKWRQAVYVIGGSPGLTGAPALAAAGAIRSGAGYVARSIPGSAADRQTSAGADPANRGGDRRSIDGTATWPIEAVTYPVPRRWARPVLDRLGRFGSAVVGPGLVSDDPTELDHYVENTTTPTVFDAGAIDGLASMLASRPTALGRGGSAMNGPLHVVTPHDGEFERLVGHRPGPDRIAEATAASARLGAVVLLKGPTTVVAHPDGRAVVSTAADQRLATAGTGDVLSGVIAAGIAGGLDPFLAAGVGAELHGRAANRGYRVGMTAGDLPLLIAELLSEMF